MSDTPDAKPLLTEADISAAPEVHISHPWGTNSDVHFKPLSAMAGLSRTVLSLARVPPGKGSFLFHAHERDEEFVYILSGRGRAEIGDDVFDVGPGDFMGFQAPGGPAHQLINPFEEDLVYLMDGERSGFDIAHFPREGKRIIFHGGDIQAVDDSALTRMVPEQWVPQEDSSES